MIAHILHSEDRDHDRLPRLLNDLKRQKINDYKLFPIIRDKMRCTSISKGHKQIVQYAKDNNLPECFIMEDDCRWGSLGAYDYFLSKKPADADIYLGGCYVVYFDKEPFKSKLIGFISLHCYIIRQSFYDTFLNLPEDIDIDRALNGNGNFEICYPYAAIQYNGWSDNSRQIENYDHLLAGKEVFGLGKF